MSSVRCDSSSGIVCGIAGGLRVAVRLKFKAQLGTVVRSLTEHEVVVFALVAVAIDDARNDETRLAADTAKRDINLTRGRSSSLGCNVVRV